MDQSLDLATNPLAYAFASASRYICPVIECNSSINNLNLWKKNHACPSTSKCHCPVPYSFLPFPKEEEERYRWTKIINRKDTTGKGGLMSVARGAQLICSRHFMKGCKLPLFCLGYGKKPLSPGAKSLVFDENQIPPMIQNIESRTMKVRIPFSLDKAMDAPQSTVVFIDRTSTSNDSNTARDNAENADKPVKRSRTSSKRVAANKKKSGASSAIAAETNTTSPTTSQRTPGAVQAPKRYAKIQRIAPRSSPSENPAVAGNSVPKNADIVNRICCACRKTFEVTSLNANQGVLSKICVIMQLRTVPEEILNRQICAECCATVNKAFDIVSNVMQGSNGDNGSCAPQGQCSKDRVPQVFGDQMDDAYHSESTPNLSDQQNEIPGRVFNSLDVAGNSPQVLDRMVMKREVLDEVLKETGKVPEKVTEAQFEIKQEILDDSYGDIIKEEITEALGAIYGTDLIANNESFENNRTEEVGLNGSALNFGAQNNVVRPSANPVPNANKPAKKRRKRTPATPLSAASQLETLRARGTIQITKANPGKGRRRKTAEKVLDSEFWTELGRVGKTGPTPGGAAVPTGPLEIQRARACTTPFSDETTPEEPVCKKVKSEGENDDISDVATDVGVKTERNSEGELTLAPNDVSIGRDVVNERISHGMKEEIDCFFANPLISTATTGLSREVSKPGNSKVDAKTLPLRKANVFMRYTDYCRVRCKNCSRTFLGYSRLLKHKKYFHPGQKPQNSQTGRKAHSLKRKTRKPRFEEKTHDTSGTSLPKIELELEPVDRQSEKVPPSLALRLEPQCTHTSEKPHTEYSHISEKPFKSESEIANAKTEQIVSDVAVKTAFSVQTAALDYKSSQVSRPLPSTEITKKKIFVENCRICSLYQPSWKHTRMHDPDYGPFKCESCQLYFKTKNPRTKHMNLFHGPENSCAATLPRNLSNSSWEKDAMNSDRTMNILNSSLIGTGKPQSQVLRGFKIVRASKV